MLDKVRGPIARADRAFDRRRQASLRPVASQKQILPGRFCARTPRILLRRGGEGRPALANDLPWRKRVRKTGDLRDVIPDHLGYFGPRHIEQTAAIADRGRYLARQRKYPLASSVDDAKHRRQLSRRIDTEMRVYDSTKRRWRCQVRHDVRSDIRWNCEDDGIILTEIDGPLGKSHPRHASIPEQQLYQLVLKCDRNTALAQMRDRRLDKYASQSFVC